MFYIVKCGHPQSKATIKARESGHNCSKNQKEVIHYTAIGDSLTEGIGDLTNSGGFVPIVADDLKEHYNLNGVQTDNFGKNGDRSDQILKRIKEKPEIQKGPCLCGRDYANGWWK